MNPSRKEPGVTAPGKRAGYTLTEVMMAVAFTGGILATVLTGYSLAYSILQGARENLRAIQILQEKMETVRLYSWDQMQIPGFIPTTFKAPMNVGTTNEGTIYTGTLRVNPVPFTESYSSNLVQVEIDLNWMSGHLKRHRKMTTFVSKYGLQNYIY